ncbi:amino acid ABC transporter substrate-binding protein, PAAT family [Peptoclostridium litorale DSM 5388]|uniref:Cystine-binding periplasmic protein FliY n=1 Tax=Peptoclostridium litorale DSM 5388 TaxID=1121324 RepID=A0A069RKF8_PEPLI|nr:amino acid ABC transporter substrate-binding protein [Peptoclostridium litorale]KDR94702.1 cystine-binding periplasmic protein FliY [Peptoclostridium litorale DSM 5388]SIO32829.1 amino acid ABC transporter substrate-binding protein, PAAT family [Peptoclostridium litorale DSM 5388]
MKKRLLTLISLVIMGTLIFAGCGQKEESSADESLQKIKEKGEFVVGLDDSFPPMGFRDESGEIVGFDIDLAKEAASRMGVNVTFKPVDWDGVILSLKNGDIDVIWNGLTITEDRKKNIAFTNPYLSNNQIIVVQKNSDIQSKGDFEGKTVGIQMGSTAQEALDNNADFTDSLKEVRKYSNNVEALLDLKAGRLEGVVVDGVVGRYYIAENKAADDYRVLSDDLGKESYGVGLRQEDAAFLGELNKALEEMKEDGTAAEISKKWFGEDIVVK